MQSLTLFKHSLNQVNELKLTINVGRLRIKAQYNKIQCGAKKLHRFIFAISLSNQDIF